MEEREMSSKKESKYKWTIAVLVLVVVAFGAYNLGSSGSATGGAVVNPSAGNNAPVPTVADIELTDKDHVLGDSDAEVTIVEYSDFECPFCGRLYEDAVRSIKSDYVDTGKVKFIYRHFPLSIHPNAQKSSEAAECAGEQDMFWEMHDMLFEKGVSGGVTSYKAYAADLGLDTAKFDDCLDSGKTADKVKADMAEGQKNGVRGTPATFVNGKLIGGAVPYATFQAAIDAEL